MDRQRIVFLANLKPFNVVCRGHLQTTFTSSLGRGFMKCQLGGMWAARVKKSQKSVNTVVCECTLDYLINVWCGISILGEKLSENE